MFAMQLVSAWLSDFHINLFWLFCFCVMFVIIVCECLIVRFPHSSILTILLLCHVCDYSLWVLDCQISTSIHFDYSASVPCLWLQIVSSWLSDFHIHTFWLFCFCAMCVIIACESLIVRFPDSSVLTILLLCHVCDYRKWVLDCQISTLIHFDYSASVPHLWL